MAESEVSSSVTKAFFVCDLCLFSVDLTSLVATDKEKQKNDMLLAIVLEHLVPHTESLMNVIASNAANQTFSLKYEILCRVQDNKDNKSKKLVLSLQKKFKSQHSHIEIPIDKDEDKTMSQLRAGVKADRKNYIALRNAKGQTIGDANAAGQLIEVDIYNLLLACSINKIKFLFRSTNTLKNKRANLESWPKPAAIRPS